MTDSSRLLRHLCLWGCFLLGCGLAVDATTPPRAALARLLPPDPELESLLRGVENKYNRIKTLRLHFQQIYQQDQQVLREEGGTLYLRKPGQMRWEYENPEPKLFLADGRLLTLYVPAERRVTETQAAESEDLRSPLRFLLGGMRFHKDFQLVERVSDFPSVASGNVMLKAVPKQMRDLLETVFLEISPDYQIRRLILKEPGGIQTEFRFENEAVDLNLSPELFHFRPPQGTEVVRQ